MSIAQLRALIAKYPESMPVMILDGFNGGGTPREINLDGPRTITAQHADDAADCEGLEGQTVLVLGYGCY